MPYAIDFKAFSLLIQIAPQKNISPIIGKNVFLQQILIVWGIHYTQTSCEKNQQIIIGAIGFFDAWFGHRIRIFRFTSKYG